MAERARHAMVWTTVIIVLILGGIGALRALHRPTKKNMGKYDWLASNSAPKGCPMEIANGSAFLLRGGGSLYVPPATIHSGWGKSVSTHVVGEELKPLPEQLMVTFYSYLEDKIYHGLFDLPSDQIAAQFANGFLSYGKGSRDERNYEVITVGVAPGGAVAVWIEGAGKRKEIMFGHAQELNRDFHSALQLPPHVERTQRRDAQLAHSTKTDPRVAEMLKHIPIGVWDTYRTSYDWHLLFEGLPAPKYIASVHYYNGEYESWPWPLSRSTEADQRAVPSSITFFSKLPGDEYATQYAVTFDEQEILRAFRRLGSVGLPVDLILRQAERLEVILHNAREEVALVDFNYELYESKRQ